MIHMSFRQAADLLGCGCPQSEATFTGIATDSRKIAPGMLFAALPGRTFDGHDHVQQAMERGAVGVLLCRKVETELPVLLVADVLAALGVLARSWRRECATKVVGITGSNGKTTVKEMIASVLRQSRTVLATQGNFNNELGLPLTLFQLNKSHDCAVLEMGASNPGDIAYLAAIAQPDVGVVTNIGPAHLQGFINVEGVARAKGELYAALPRHGTAIFNAAEPWVDLWHDINSAATVSYFNGEGENHIRAHHSGDEVVVSTPAGEFSLRLGLPGQHNVINALTATAVCLALDVPLEDIKTGLETVKSVPGRLNLVHSSAGLDSYR